MNKKRLGAFAFAALLAVAVALPAEAATRAEIEAQIATLKAQLAALVGGTSMHFTADLGLGSTGSEVTRLQSFLIEKGYAIPAGATGYFGEQTRAALARFQAANGIAPAAGHFGPLTRTKVNATLVVVAPAPAETPDEDEDDARETISGLEDAIADAQDDIDEAEDDGADVDDANGLLDDAREKLADAESALDDEDYEEAADLADEGMDLVEEALDEADANADDDNEGDADTTGTSAKTTVVSGSDNDYATFEIELDLTAFGDDMYVPRNGADGFTYRIEDAGNGSTVAGGVRTATLSSTADERGDYFILREDGEETFTFRVTFNPDAADEGKSFRLQLLTIEYSDEEQAPTASWSTQGDNEFETGPAFIAD